MSGARRGAATAGLALAIAALSACGLLAPAEPPAAEIDATPWAPPPDVPIPAQPPAPPPSAPSTPSTPSTPSDPTAPPPIPPTAPFPGYTLAWHDEFDGSALDTSAWAPADGTNRPGNVASPEAVQVKNGVLRLAVYTDAAGVSHTGIVSTVGKRETTYGYYEAHLRPTQAPGNWCSFWINSPTIGNPIGDPGTAGVEIDVIEHRYENRDHYDLSNFTYMNLNWDGYGTEWKQDGRLTMLPGNGPVQDTWRTYAVLWTPTGYIFYVDGQPLWKTSAAISNRPEYVVLSCEAVNNSWAGWVPPGGYGTLATSTTGLQVDWVRVWQKQ